MVVLNRTLGLYLKTQDFTHWLSNGSAGEISEKWELKKHKRIILHLFYQFSTRI